MLLRYPASYPAIGDMATSVSLNKLFGCWKPPTGRCYTADGRTILSSACATASSCADSSSEGLSRRGIRGTRRCAQKRCRARNTPCVAHRQALHHEDVAHVPIHGSLSSERTIATWGAGHIDRAAPLCLGGSAQESMSRNVCKNLMACRFNVCGYWTEFLYTAP